MALWGNKDAANNSTIFAAAQVKKKANTANRDALFSNTTPDAFITGATIGQFGVDTQEVQANGDIPHPGWVLRTVGSGGRAGRVHHEVLVAMNSITEDFEDVAYPDYTLSIKTQPADSSEEVGSAVTFTVVAQSKPKGATLTYQWQESQDGGDTFANLTVTGVYSDVATDTLAIADNTGLDGYIYRVVVGAAGAADITSGTALLTEVPSEE